MIKMLNANLFGSRAEVFINLRQEYRSLFIGGVVGACIIYGGFWFEQRQLSQAWGYALNMLVEEAEAELMSAGCLSDTLHSRMKEYETMSYHGFWCGILTPDDSRFDTTLRSPVCSR